MKCIFLNWFSDIRGGAVLGLEVNVFWAILGLEAVFQTEIIQFGKILIDIKDF